MSEFSPDAQPRRREPVFNMPGVIVLFVAIFAGIHAWREYLIDAVADGDVLRRFAFVPGRLTAVFDMDAIAATLTSLSRDANQLDIARYFLDDGSAQYWTLISYSFLHGDWVHLGVNSLWLAAFGAPVAHRFGWLRFVALFAVTAVAGALMYYVFHRMEFVPMVGASASISGIMAAAIRFVFVPGGPLGPAIYPIPLPPHLAARLPAAGLIAALSDRRVVQFTLTWFIINFVFGLASVPLGITAAAVAWEAHAGGFLAGFLLFNLFDPPPPDPSEFGDWLPPDDLGRHA